MLKHLKQKLKKTIILLLALSFPLVCFGGVDLDGTDGQIDFGNIAEIDSADEITVSAWVYHDNVDSDDGISAQNNSSTDGWLFWRDETGQSRDNTYAIYIHEGEGGGDSVRCEGAEGAAVINTWTHVCFTYKTTAFIHLYINGVEDANSPVANSNVGNISSDGQVFMIGDTSDSSKPFHGKISELAVWEKQLTGAQVAQLANGKVRGLPLQIQSSSLILYVPLDDLSAGTTINTATFVDRSGNGNNGTGSDSGGESTGYSEEVLSYPPGVQ